MTPNYSRKLRKLKSPSICLKSEYSSKSLELKLIFIPCFRCLTNQIDTRELNKGFEKRQILINKLKSKQFSNEHPVLRIIQKLREINKEN